MNILELDTSPIVVMAGHSGCTATAPDDVAVRSNDGA
ncbi:hypothetical protein J2Y89_001458 [Curtobacterium herbarum]|nr:hypothetical protein [Curtobacterium herbarum]